MAADMAPECENHLRRHLANPFLVLELPPEATRDEIAERSGDNAWFSEAQLERHH